MKNKLKRGLSLALASIMLLGLLAGCGGGNAGEDPGPDAGNGVISPEEELQAALDREEQAKQDAIQEEIDKREENTKPGGEQSSGRPNSGDGGGIAGLDDDGGEDENPGEDIGDDETDIPGGEYAYDGTYSIPSGMPSKLTMESLGVPEWSGQPWVVINDNMPFFGALTSRPRLGTKYSSVDKLRRSGYAQVVLREPVDPMADYSVNVQQGTLSVPGWNRDAYDGVIETIDKSNMSSGKPYDGELFYLRRIIGSGLVDTELGRRNSLVCTQYMGEYGLKTLEDAVLTYLQRYARRVVYRVTPVFEGKEVIARGCVVEAMSYGDTPAALGAGLDLCFCMFVYNVQPGVIINYLDGTSDIDDLADPDLTTILSSAYVLDTSRRQAHKTNCYMLVRDVKPAVQSYYYGTLEDLVKWSFDWNACDCMDGDYVPPENVVPPEEDPDDPLGHDDIVAPGTGGQP